MPSNKSSLIGSSRSNLTVEYVHSPKLVSKTIMGIKVAHFSYILLGISVAAPILFIILVVTGMRCYKRHKRKKLAMYKQRFEETQDGVYNGERPENSTRRWNKHDVVYENPVLVHNYVEINEESGLNPGSRTIENYDGSMIIMNGTVANRQYVTNPVYMQTSETNPEVYFTFSSISSAKPLNNQNETIDINRDLELSKLSEAGTVNSNTKTSPQKWGFCLDDRPVILARQYAGDSDVNGNDIDRSKLNIDSFGGTLPRPSAKSSLNSADAEMRLCVPMSPVPLHRNPSNIECDQLNEDFPVTLNDYLNGNTEHEMLIHKSESLESFSYSQSSMHQRSALTHELGYHSDDEIISSSKRKQKSWLYNSFVNKGFEIM